MDHMIDYETDLQRSWTESQCSRLKLYDVQVPSTLVTSAAHISFPGNPIWLQNYCHFPWRIALPQILELAHLLILHECNVTRSAKSANLDHILVCRRAVQGHCTKSAIMSAL